MAKPTLNDPFDASPLHHPTICVMVPRAKTAHYADLPFADVLAAGEARTDGCEIVQGRPRLWRALSGEDKPPILDVAFLAEGEYGWKGKTVLYQQNWTERE